MIRLAALGFGLRASHAPRRSQATGALAAALGIALWALGLPLVLGTAAEAQTLRKGDKVAGSATVVDGQSFDIKSDRFKLWGIDTPDRNTSCYRNGRRWRPTPDARTALHRCVDGKTVTCQVWRLERKWFRDIYVSECWTDDGTDVGECMIRSGWATDYTCFSGGYYSDVEKEAKNKGIGLWSCDNGPGTRRWGRGGRGAPCETPRYKPIGPTAKQL
jgi:endonuclease YncB( thermonuclease family)